MHAIRALVAAAVLVAFVQPVAAQSAGEVKARALFKEGNKQLEAGNYVGALEMYEEAYKNWNNPKILLNMGTAQRSLGRNADACATYEKWLDDPKADAARKKEVETTLADLSRKVGWIEITASEAGAKLMLDGKEAGTGSAHIRIDPGSHMITAELEGFELGAQTVAVAAGETKKAALALVKRGGKTPDPATQPDVGIVKPIVPVDPVDPLEGGVTRKAPKIGALLRGDAILDLDPPPGSGSLLFGGAVGALYNVTPEIAASVSVVIGGVFGAYAGGTYSMLAGDIHPFGEVGVPILFSDELSLGGRGAAGVRYDLGKIGIVGEVAAEYYFAGTFSGDLYIVPSLGIQAGF